MNRGQRIRRVSKMIGAVVGAVVARVIVHYGEPVFDGVGGATATVLQLIGPEAATALLELLTEIGGAAFGAYKAPRNTV